MRWIIAIIIFISFLPGCMKDAEIQKKSYPYVITGGITDIAQDGATLHARVIEGVSEVVEYGFVLASHMSPNYNDHVISFMGSTQNFSSRVKAALEKDVIYFVRAYAKTLEHMVYGNEVSFISKGSMPPEIDFFSPVHGPKGTRVEIHGKNFSPVINGNVVRFDKLIAYIESAASDKIVVTTPETLISLNVPVSVETARMITVSQGTFSMWYPWVKLRDLDFTVDNYAYASFSHNGKGYIIFSNTNVLVEYDAGTNTILHHNMLPVNSGSMPLAASFAGSIYLLLENSLFSFNPDNFEFSLISEYPLARNKSDFMFLLHDMIYIGSTALKRLLMFDADLKVWADKNASSPLFSVYNHYYRNYYSHNDIGYFLQSSSFTHEGSHIYKYNPSADTWQLVSAFPYTTRGYGFEFFSGNKLYVGLGQQGKQSVWELDLFDNQWSGLIKAPKRMVNIISIMINGKGYAFALKKPDLSYLNELWEFDPSKL